MVVGCVKEIKNNEFRVGLTPDNVRSYIKAGHRVLIERGAGVGSGFPDDEYAAAGAEIIDSAKDVWDAAEMMVKVKATGVQHGGRTGRRRDLPEEFLRLEIGRAHV